MPADCVHGTIQTWEGLCMKMSIPNYVLVIVVVVIAALIIWYGWAQLAQKPDPKPRMTPEELQQMHRSGQMPGPGGAAQQSQPPAAPSPSGQ